MKYLIGFLLFWRRFVVGDDSRIAIVVMWTILFSWSLATNYYNPWMLIPAVLIVLIATICHLETTKSRARKKHTMIFKSVVSVQLPFFAVVFLPLLLFRVTSGHVDVETAVIPGGLFALTAIILGSVLYPVVKTLPILAVFVAGSAAYLVNLLGQPHYLHASSVLYAIQPIASTIAALVLIGLFGVVVWRGLRN